MTEKLHTTPEQQHNHEADRSQERSHAEKLKENAAKAEHAPKDNIEAIQKSIESTAISGKELSIGEKEKPVSSSPLFVTRKLKNDAYKRLMKKTQSHLSKSERSFSKVIHRPAVEKTSEIASKTIARPSGILFGGIAAFVATVFLLIVSKRAGFTYNYLFFFLVFVGGYFVGLIAELLYRLVKHPERS
jgi:hypothetical protein